LLAVHFFGRYGDVCHTHNHGILISQLPFPSILLQIQLIRIFSIMYRSDDKEDEEDKRCDKGMDMISRIYRVLLSKISLSLCICASLCPDMSRAKNILCVVREGGRNESIYSFYSVNCVLIGMCVSLSQRLASLLPSNSILRQRSLKRSLGLSGKATCRQTVFSQLLWPQGLY
jgi:hypothetical protein